MLHVHRSNRVESLLGALVEVLRKPLSDPFAAETIAVSSRGMERWLAMELSRRFGVWAHARFPFPRHLLDALLDAALGPVPAERPRFDERTIAWAVAALLPARLGAPAFAPVRGYLQGDTDGTRRLALANRIARVFDDYLVYRPEMVLDWQAGRTGGVEDDWQPALFRDLVARLGEHHQAARAHALQARLAAGDVERGLLPPRVCLFGAATLPPLYVSILSALAAHVDVHVFVPTPCKEYFADVRREQPAPTLLASLGRTARELQDVLEERARKHEVEHFDDPGLGCALHALQSDLLGFRMRPTDDAPLLELAPDDDSIAVHACHGPMREVEVLHDQLVALFEDRTLQPRDVVVMAPDIEAYAPYIEAVFDGAGGGRREIPHSIVRRRVRPTDDVVAAFHMLLDAMRGRMPASQVLDLLGLPPVRRSLALTESEVETLRGWVERSGIRWGADAEHRREVGQPPLADNTWRFGLDRMLLGYAFEGRGQQTFAERLPFDEVQGGAAAALGKLTALCQRLFDWRQRLREARSVEAWCADLSSMAADILDPALGSRTRAIDERLSEIAREARAAGFSEPVGLAGLVPLIEAGFDDALPPRGFLSGGVTFCQLEPMRSIPFRVVCLLGMNDDAFPRRATALGFDLIAREPQLGDRSVREDDRSVFLDALLSARERLIITYVGQGIQDNRVIPPSVVVHELLDALARTYAPSEGGSARAATDKRFVVHHKLHAYSPSYFDRSDPRLFSYAPGFVGSARKLAAEREEPSFLTTPLTQPEPSSPLVLQLEALERWCTRPISTFVQSRLDVYLGRDLDPVQDREPIELDPLERWKLGDDLLRQLVTGVDRERVWQAARASGALPLGTPGRLVFDAVARTAEALDASASVYRGDGPLPQLPITLDVGGVRIVGTLGDLWRGAHLRVVYSRAGVRAQLVHWIRHLVLQTAIAREGLADHPRDSVYVCRGAKDERLTQVVRFGALDDAEERLGDLVALVVEAQRTLVPFVQRTSLAYAQAIHDEKEPDAALSDAQTAFSPYDEADPYVRLAFTDFEGLVAEREPIDFAAAARRVYGPMLAAGKDA